MVALVRAVKKTRVVKHWQIDPHGVNGSGVGVADDDGGGIGLAETLERVREGETAPRVVKAQDGVLFK